jgi:hypothetical protein
LRPYAFLLRYIRVIKSTVRKRTLQEHGGLETRPPFFCTT